MSAHQLLEKIDGFKQKLTDQEYKEICDITGKIFKKSQRKPKQKPEYTPHKITYVIPCLEKVNLDQTQGRLFGTVTMEEVSFIHPYVKIDPQAQESKRMGNVLVFKTRTPMEFARPSFVKDISHAQSKYSVETEEHDITIDEIKCEIFIISVEPYVCNHVEID